VKNFLLGLWEEFQSRWDDSESNIRIITGTTLVVVMLLLIVCAA